MRIQFAAGTTSCEFRRDPMFGKAELIVGDEVVVLQSPLDPATHLAVSRTRSWECRLPDHLIRVEKNRPLLFAGVLPHDYRVLVDGQEVAHKRGY